MGEKSENIFDSFALNETDSKDFQKVLDKFEKFFVPKRNIIFERARFLKRKQGGCETVENFVTDLHNLAKTCEWGVIEDEMILMVLIVGMRDELLSDRLQLEPDLKLETALQTVRKSEELVRQKQELRLSSEVDKVQKSNKHFSENRPMAFSNAHKIFKDNPPRSNKTNFTDKNRYTSSCFWCGSSTHHQKEFCPAKSQRCSHCGKIGHFNKVCRSKNIHNVSSELIQSQQEAISEMNDDDSGQLYSVNSILNNTSREFRDPWKIDLIVNDCYNMQFKIDTGADVSVIPSHTMICKKLKVEPTTKVLKGANGKELLILGKSLVKLSYKNKLCHETVYISKGCSQPLLGKPAIENLQILARINEIQHSMSTDWCARHPKLFTGLGSTMGKYKIELKHGAKPYSINTPRRIPLPLWGPTKDQLKNMIEMGVISEVKHATDWCAPMVVVPKKDCSKIRVCVDLSRLNESVKRRFYPIQPVDITLAQITNASIYSKLDANHGFWQINLDEESQDLTTFLTPFGRFKFLKLPFGISSAPEVFQQYVNKTLQGQKNAVAHMDDIVVWGANQEDHDRVLEEVLSKLERAGFTLNKEKCIFSQKSITFLGHHLSEKGIQIDKEKVEAIVKMPPPKDIASVQRLIGMVNFIGKYIPNRSQILKPITDLLSTKNHWVWGDAQQSAFVKLKKLLTSPPLLAFYDISYPTMISADASQHGLGGVLLQQQVDKTWKPVSYISRTLSDSEKNYSNIEREALAITWSCDKFSDFITAKDIVIETDHKPLTSILTKKDLSDLTPRLQRLRMRLLRYSYTVVYTPGKHLATADCLSRNPIVSNEKYDMEEEIETSVTTVISTLGTTDIIIQRVSFAQKESQTLQKVFEYCSSDWPDRSKVPFGVKPYYSVRNEISVCDGILMRNDRLIIPESLRPEMLNRIHAGHMGITKCRLRAGYSMWWPGISGDIEKLVSGCPLCTEYRSQHHEPLLPSDFPSRPWEKASMDLFKLQGTWFLAITDCYSRFLEIATLKSLTASEVIEKCKSVFSRHGIPLILRSDCGTQFASTRSCLENMEFRAFAKEYNFNLVVSSPGHHQSNGAGEAAVKVAKNLLKKNKEDPYLALLAYRNTPLSHNGLSPAQLLFNRQLRDNLPSLPSNLDRKPDTCNLREREEAYRANYKSKYDKRYGVRDLPDLQIGQKVWIHDLKRSGVIKSKASEPRSFWVETEKNTVRRNRFHLSPYNEKPLEKSTCPLPIFLPKISSTLNRNSYRHTAGTHEETLQSSVSSIPNVDSNNPYGSPPAGNSNESSTPANQKTKSGRVVVPPKRLTY